MKLRKCLLLCGSYMFVAYSTVIWIPHPEPQLLLACPPVQGVIQSFWMRNLRERPLGELRKRFSPFRGDEQRKTALFVYNMPVAMIIWIWDVLCCLATLQTQRYKPEKKGQEAVVATVQRRIDFGSSMTWISHYINSNSIRILTLPCFQISSKKINFLIE